MELETMQLQVLSLLERLERPPRAVRVQSGEIVLDISWPEPVAGPMDQPPVTAAPASAGEPAAAVVQGPPATPSLPAAGPDEAYLTSPSVGVFYHCPGPGAEPFVSVGSPVKVGQQIGIIEAMKLMIPIEAEREGTITSVLKENGQPVEYAERLYALAVSTEE